MLILCCSGLARKETTKLQVLVAYKHLALAFRLSLAIRLQTAIKQASLRLSTIEVSHSPSRMRVLAEVPLWGSGRGARKRRIQCSKQSYSFHSREAAILSVNARASGVVETCPSNEGLEETTVLNHICVSHDLLPALVPGSITLQLIVHARPDSLSFLTTKGNRPRTEYGRCQAHDGHKRGYA